MTQSIERPSMGAVITTEVVDRFQAAKRWGIDCWSVYDAIREGKLTPVGTGKRGEDLVLVAQVEEWLGGLTPLEKVVIFPCTRKGCSQHTDRSSHKHSITNEGLPRHGHHVFSNYVRVPGEKYLVQHFANPKDHPTEWTVGLRAIGDEPWEVEAEILNFQVWLPHNGCATHGVHQIPDVLLLSRMITKAVNLRDKLNSEAS